MIDQFDARPEGLFSGVTKKEPNPTNWQFAKLKMCKATPEVKLPSKVSLKEGLPPCWLQHYGNCTSYSVLGADAYYYHKNKPTWEPSGTFTYYVQRKMAGLDVKEDVGGCVENAIDAVKKYGVCNSTVWPNSMPFGKKPSKEAYANGLKGHEVKKYYQLKSLLQTKKALALGYPIAASFNWPFKSIDENFVLNTPTKAEVKKSEDGHAVTLVGYDDKKKLFEFRNSWGPTWANSGYAYMTYEAYKLCIDYDDTYAIVK